jgi:hypothetical protein
MARSTDPESQLSSNGIWERTGYREDERGLRGSKEPDRQRHKERPSQDCSSARPLAGHQWHPVVQTELEIIDMQPPLAINDVLDADQKRVNNFAVRIFAQNFSGCTLAQLVQRSIHPSSCFVFIAIEDSQRMFPGRRGESCNNWHHTSMILHLARGPVRQSPLKLAAAFHAEGVRDRRNA